MAREAVISTSALNAYGTRILTEGLDIEQYKKNPIVLYMHRRGSREDIPIGIMENIRVDGDKIFGTPKIDKDTEEEKVIAAKWERGTLRMLSAGIDIIECSDDPQYLVQGQTRPTIIRSRLSKFPSWTWEPTTTPCKSACITMASSSPLQRRRQRPVAFTQTRRQTPKHDFSDE